MSFTVLILAMFIQCLAPLFTFCADAARQIPARHIPVPDSVSAEMQQAITAPFAAHERVMKYVPKSEREWRYLLKEHNKQSIAMVAWLQEHFPVASIESQNLGGVHIYYITPHGVLEDNAQRILINVHGGTFVFSPGEASIPEAMLVAYYTRMPVVAIDYRMPPDHPFPAGLEDVVAVYRALLNFYPATKIGMFGVSSGGNLIAAAMLRLKALGLPLPAALSLGAPVCDLRKEGGDSHFTNEYIDNALVTCDGLIRACVELYTKGRDLHDPLLSPIYGDFSQFPPCILTSGTRDLLLSDTVRVYVKLREAGVEAKLQVFEGLSHSQYLTVPYAPESRLALSEIAAFFNDHLAN